MISGSFNKSVAVHKDVSLVWVLEKGVVLGKDTC